MGCGNSTSAENPNTYHNRHQQQDYNWSLVGHQQHNHQQTPAQPVGRGGAEHGGGPLPPQYQNGNHCHNAATFSSLTAAAGGGGQGGVPAPGAPPPTYQESQLHPNGNGAPIKYMRCRDGIRRINPEYLQFQEQQQQRHGGNKLSGLLASAQATVPSCKRQTQYLATVSTMEEYECYFGDAPLSQDTDRAIEQMQDQPELQHRVGLGGGGAVPPPPNYADAGAHHHVHPTFSQEEEGGGGEMVDELGKILAKYEAPIGMMPKLMVLKDFDLLEFIVDDSGSMSSDSDQRVRPGGPFLSRWEEVRQRLESMFEIISCVPTPPISIVFLNRKDHILLRPDGTSTSGPRDFMKEAKAELGRVWYRNPCGLTPAFQAIQRSFQDPSAKNKKVVRYFFGDGQPNGGQDEEIRIAKFIKDRNKPQHNPFTFMSCTDNDLQTEWMKDCEEIAPYCAEYDDFLAESREVARDHGLALPYSLGMHLVGQLVGALHPHDLDAMDDSVPLTKGTLEGLLGTTHTDPEYHHYFSHFIKAQKQRTGRTRADKLRQEMRWDRCYEDFLTAKVPRDISAVRSYYSQLAKL